MSMEPSRPTVLVVDDKRNMLRLMAKVLRDEARIMTAENGQAAVRVLEEEPIDVVLCDLKMPDMDGLEVLRATKRLRPAAEFILMTAYATVDTAVDALRQGAYDYLTKPFEPEQARTVVLRALGRAAIGRIPEQATEEVLPGLVARSRPMQELAEVVHRVADSEVTTVLLGETGTGKERVARAIHQLSPRNPQRFVPLNCAAIPVDLLESELFGYRRGSFTGAAHDRAGLFEEASQGTLFLDEIGEMRLHLQAKLTRVLEERSIRRIGDSKERNVDVRIVAATHQDLEEMVTRGTFREDLWYRLNVAVVRIPALRDRQDDIELLAVHFLRELGANVHGRTIAGFTPAAIDAMVSYRWPGNVRQLRAAVELACVVATGERVDVGDLPPEVRAGAIVSGRDSWEDLKWVEAQERGRAEVARRYLEAVLRRFDGDVTKAAAHAGVERESFYRLMRRYGIEVEVYRVVRGAGRDDDE